MSKAPAKTRRLAFGLTFGAAAVLPVILAAVALGYFAVRSIYASKSRDTVALLFLEHEAKATRLAGALREEAKRRTSGAPDLAFRWEKGQLAPVKGEIRNALNLQGFGLSALELPDETSVLRLLGRTYLAKVVEATGKEQLDGTALAKGRYLYLWNVVPQKLLRWPSAGGDVVAYIVSREGKLVHATRDEMDDKSMLARPLVQAFIAAPLRQGQARFLDDKGLPYLGYYQEIVGTNLVLFAEAPSRVREETMAAVGGTFVWTAMVLIVVVGVLAGFASEGLVRPLRALTHVADALAVGRETPAVGAGWFRDLLPLAGALEGIRTRVTQMEETTQKAEAAAKAATLTELLEVPSGVLHADDEVRVVAGSPTVGDFRACLVDEARGLVVGASLKLTVPEQVLPALRGLLDEALSRAVATGATTEGYLRRVHEVLLALGDGAWTATGVAFTVMREARVVEVSNAGAPGLVVVTPGKEAPTIREMALQSSMLGRAPELRVATEAVAVQDEALVLVRTGDQGLPLNAKEVEKLRDRCVLRIEVGATVADVGAA